MQILTSNETIHQTTSGHLLSGIHAHVAQPQAARRTLYHASVALALTLSVVLSTRPLAAQVPSVVATSPQTIDSAVTGGPVAIDACGDIWEYGQDGSTGIIEIQASTGNVITVVKNTQGYASGPGFFMDAAKKNVYFPDFTNFYTNHFDQVPIVNCLPGTVNNTFNPNFGYPFGDYYFGTINAGAGDANGDVFFSATQGTTGAIVEEIYTASSATYSPVYALASWPNSINFLASDASGNLYFSDQLSSFYNASGTQIKVGTKIYLLKAGYTAAPTLLAGGFNNIVGLTFDTQGNLIVSDAGNAQNAGTSTAYEIPLENAVLNPADQFALAQVPLVNTVAVDSGHNLYLANYTSGAIVLKASSAVAPAVALGSHSTVPVNYVFNASVTPTSILTVTGTTPSAAFSAGTAGCIVGTAYTVGSACSVTTTYTPNAVGGQTGALLFTSSVGTVRTDLSSIGQGAAATIDPGTVVPTATTLTAPSGVTVDNLGNVFVTDTTANTLTEFVAGSNGVGTPVSTGALTLNAPKAVAVDNIGDIFIADTGNSRIVEIPVVSGVLTNASATVLSLTLKNPQGIATDGAGNLYIADTGDNSLLFVPNIGGTIAVSSAQSFGASLSGPAAVAVDSTGNVFLSETGNNDVLEFPAPLGSTAQIKVASGLSDPTSLATDASGSLFVVDNGTASIFRYPNVGGNFGTHTLAGSSVAHPTSVGTDAVGNLYATDNADDLVVEIQRVASALQFGGWNVGTTSTPLTGTISSSGNEPLIFQSPSYTVGGNTSAGFSVTADTCAGQSEIPGGSCAITSTFTPPAPELNAQENLNLASNAANGAPVLQLVGTGAHITPSNVSLALTSPAGNPTLNAGESVTFTATIGTGAGTAMPGGAVKFFVNGTQVGTAAVTNDAASITLKNGLPAGNGVIVLADYTGDVINYSGSTAQITENVVALPDTVTLAITAPYNNPLSANDNAANAKGPSIPLIATVVPSSAAAPGGTVTFYAGTTVLGVIAVAPAATGGYQAILNTTALRAGTTNTVEDLSLLTTYNISAVYSGDTSYYPATSNSVAISIVSPPVTPPSCATAGTCHKNTTGATFTITPANPTITATTTTTAGPASGSTTLSINSYGGWNGIVNFTCSGLPAYATCSPFPGYPNGVPSTPGVNVSPTTVDFIINTNVAPIIPTGSSMTWWISGFAGLLLLATRRRIRKIGYLRAGQLFTTLGAALLLTGSAIGISGCSSSGFTSITPAGSSVVTVKMSAAQLNVSSSTAGATFPPDSDVPSFQITLVVK